MYKRLITFSLFILLITPMSFAYSPNDDKTQEEINAEIKENARELLRETSAMASTLVSPTNRINFTIKSADILWRLEEKDARAMFSNSTEDIKRLIAQIDLETNQKETSSNTSWGRRGSVSGLRTKTNQVFSMRNKLVTALANHDPDWALRFVRETNQMFTNKKLVSRAKRDDKRLEASIARKIADKDISKALALGRERLSKGVTSDVVSLLSNIYAKDKEKGAEFASDILQKLKSTTLTRSNSWILIRLFKNGLATVDAEENPLFDKFAMKDLAELIASQITNPKSRYRNLSSSVMTGIETHSPNSASQIKRVFEERVAARAAKSRSRSGNSSNNSRRKAWEERSKAQSEISKDLNNLSDESLSDEDRQTFIAQTKSKILSIEGDNYRFNGLVGLAMRVAGLGDKESAVDILNEAETYLNQDPKVKLDFSRNQSLANAYALVDTSKSFVILEDMVYRLNSVVNGYIKYMEFTGSRSIVENNELIINNRTRQFTNYLKLMPKSLKKLAESDYGRLKGLTDSFERMEIRIETRLLIAKSLLNATDTVENATDLGPSRKTR